MAGLRNFYDILDECRDCSKNLLLGNGFSVAYDRAVFDYQNLINDSKLPLKIKKIFNIFNTNDYELFLNNLKILSEIFHNRNIAVEMINLMQLIKRDLVRTILSKHPKSQFEIEIERKENTLLFLLNFDKIFTLNYDLLLYWTIMYYLDIKNGKVCSEYISANSNYKLDDGFNNNSPYDCVWTNNRGTQNVYYIHGALPIFYDNTNTYKIKYDVYNNVSLLKQIKDYIKGNVSPLVITEGDSDNKLQWIKQNRYLNDCYQQLGRMKDILFIHGHSLDENDKHIFEAINANQNIKAVYISVYNPSENEETIRQKAYELFNERINNKSLSVEFYNAQSVALW